MEASKAQLWLLISKASYVHRRIFWAARFGGVVVVLSIQLMLSMLGAGMGYGTVNTHAGTAPDTTNLGIGAGILWIVETCAALFAASYIAAWLDGVDTCSAARCAARSFGAFRCLEVWRMLWVPAFRQRQSQSRRPQV
jgi:hypothetical protein